jgi:plastocyanin
MKRLIPALALLALAVFVAACSGGGSGTAAPASAPASAAASGDPNAVAISAKDLKFSTDRLTGPANKPFQIAFNNEEGAPHNVSIYKDESASEQILVEDPFGGPKTVTYDVPALAPASYFFRCDVHPDMKGTLEIK